MCKVHSLNMCLYKCLKLPQPLQSVRSSVVFYEIIKCSITSLYVYQNVNITTSQYLYLLVSVTKSDTVD